MRHDFTTQVTTVPAESGWYYMEPITDDTGFTEYFDRIPVVAWVVEVDIDPCGSVIRKHVHHVAVDTTGEHLGMEALMRPDGKFIVVEDEMFDTEDGLLAHYHERERQDKANRRATA